MLIEKLSVAPPADGKIPSHKEIARLYNISVVTAVKAVEQLKVEGLVYGRAGKGVYLKDQNKLQELYGAARRTKTIGLAYLDIYNPAALFLSDLIRGVSDECRKANLNVRIFPIPSDWRHIRKEHLDGVLIGSRVPAGIIVMLQQEGMPFVWIGNDIEHEDICCVISRGRLEVNLALAHLVKLGYRRIALLAVEETRAFREDFDVLCSVYGLEGTTHIRIGEESDAGYRLTREVLSDIRPQVLFTIGTELTVSAISYISDARLSMPDDIALIGWVSSMSDAFFPRDVTVHFGSVEEMARKSVRMLDDLVNGRPLVERKAVIPGKLIIRGSCGFPMDGKKEIIVTETAELDMLAYPEGKPVKV